MGRFVGGLKLGLQSATENHTTKSARDSPTRSAVTQGARCVRTCPGRCVSPPAPRQTSATPARASRSAEASSNASSPPVQTTSTNKRGVFKHYQSISSNSFVYIVCKMIVRFHCQIYKIKIIKNMLSILE